MKLHTLTILLLIISRLSIGQLIPEPDLAENLISGKWPSSWVKMGGTQDNDYGVFLFRNTIDIKNRQDTFIVHLSADNRYKLFVNEIQVGFGPAKGDIDHWFFDTYNIADFLKKGENTIAVKVWNYGSHRPVSFTGSGTRFLCQGDGGEEQILNTPGKWKVFQDQSTSPEPINRNEIGGYIVVPPGDVFNCALNQWGWTSLEFDDSNWEKPEIIEGASPRGVGGKIDHALVPRLIPAMKYSKTASPGIRLIDGTVPDIDGIPLDDMNIPPGTMKTILLDQKELINSYPLIKFSGGKDARIRITYSEALFDANNQKGNRNIIEGKKNERLQ